MSWLRFIKGVWKSQDNLGVSLSRGWGIELRLARLAPAALVASRKPLGFGARKPPAGPNGPGL